MDNKDRELLIAELEASKAHLPKQYMSLIIHFYPEVEEDESAQTRIRNVMMGRAFDPEWIRRISFVADNYKKPQVQDHNAGLDRLIDRLRQTVRDHFSQKKEVA